MRKRGWFMSLMKTFTCEEVCTIHAQLKTQLCTCIGETVRMHTSYVYSMYYTCSFYGCGLLVTFYVYLYIPHLICCMQVIASVESINSPIISHNLSKLVSLPL